MRGSSIELLAPAGGPEQFNAALAAGADAIYCGFGHHFNARRGAESFDADGFADACRRAHLAGTRVYVTLNVVVTDAEMPRALAVARRAWLLGADGLIIQDWGLAAELRTRWPQMEVHISTQANVHDARGVAWCRDRLRAARVTLSRELSLPEIARIAQEGVELEGFGHGALCFCYSGVCQMSSQGGNRSANRGLCAQPCRLPYDLVDEQDRPLTDGPALRPLCPKDFRTIGRLDELAEAGLASLKIEGRLKGSDYVHAVVGAYRSALDELAGERPELAADERERRLRRAFNRDFTDAYLDGRSGNEMMSYERSNNRGELVGRVVATRDLGSSRVWRGGANGGRERSRTVSRAEVDIRLDEPVGAGDLLEVRPPDDPSQFLTTHAERDARAGETLVCRTARPMPAGCPVRVIRSQRAIVAAERVARADVPRSRAVKVRVRARLGQRLAIELTTVDAMPGERPTTAFAEGPVVEAARTRAISEQDLIEHVGRMGGSPFQAESFEVELDEGCGMRFSDVHKARAKACRALVERLLAPYASRTAAKAPSEARYRRDVAAALGVPTAAPFAATHTDVAVCALVGDPEVARAVRSAGAVRVYASAEALITQAWDERERPCAWLDEVCREGDHALLDPLVEAGRPVGVGNVSEFALAAEHGAKAEVRPCVPVHNARALAELVDAGAAGVWLSPELSLPEIRSLAAVSPVPVGIVAAGRARAMTSEHCVLQVSGRCVDDCARCTLRTRDLALRDAKGNRHPVRSGLDGRSRVYAASPFDAAPEVAELVAGGVRRLLVDATLLSTDEAVCAVRRLVRAVRAARAGRPAPERLRGHTAGHLHRPID